MGVFRQFRQVWVLTTFSYGYRVLNWQLSTACKYFAILSCCALVYTLVFKSQMSTKQKAAKGEVAEKSRHPLSSICYEKIEGQMDE